MDLHRDFFTKFDRTKKVGEFHFPELHRDSFRKKLDRTQKAGNFIYLDYIGIP